MDPQPEPTEPEPAAGTRGAAPVWASRPLLIALGLFVGALIVILILVARSGLGDDRLEATKLTLELSYPAGQAAIANIEGQPGAAPGGATVTCRASESGQRIGRATAGTDGGFNVGLDPAPWPLHSLIGDGSKTLSDRVECRAGSGDWVKPLRQPRVRIN